MEPLRGPRGSPAARGGRAPRPGAATASLLLGVLFAAAACAGPERSDPPVSEEAYVEVMSRLAAVRTATDPDQVVPPMPVERADSLRRAVLDRHGVTRDGLEGFARAVGDEPARMKALWKRIAAARDSLWRAGWPPLPGDRKVQGRGRDPARRPSPAESGESGSGGGR